MLLTVSATGHEVRLFHELLNFDVIGTEIADSAEPHVLGNWDCTHRGRSVGAIDLSALSACDHSFDPDAHARQLHACATESVAQWSSLVMRPTVSRS